MQGSAADLVKGAMIQLVAAFEAWNSPSKAGPCALSLQQQREAVRPHLLVQIHDELLFEVGASASHPFVETLLGCLMTERDLPMQLSKLKLSVVSYQQPCHNFLSHRFGSCLLFCGMSISCLVRRAGEDNTRVSCN